jgi:hypothetical protein
MWRDTDSRAEDPLALLSKLSNTDKHRASVSCKLTPQQIGGKFSVEFVDIGATERNLPPDMTLNVPEFQDGEMLAELHAKDAIATVTANFKVQPHISLQTPSGSQDAIAVLEALIDYVGSVLLVLTGGLPGEAPTA